jgi:hypothetical protein
VGIALWNLFSFIFHDTGGKVICELHHHKAQQKDYHEPKIMKALQTSGNKQRERTQV